MEHILYIVEEKIHYMTLNSKPLYSIKYHFFTDAESAKANAKVLRTKIPYTNSHSKVRASKFDVSQFDWFTIHKHTCIVNGIKTYRYSLRGDLNKIHPNTDEKIFIDEQFDIHTGEIINKLLKS